MNAVLNPHKQQYVIMGVKNTEHIRCTIHRRITATCTLVQTERHGCCIYNYLQNAEQIVTAGRRPLPIEVGVVGI